MLIILGDRFERPSDLVAVCTDWETAATAAIAAVQENREYVTASIWESATQQQIGEAFVAADGMETKCRKWA